MKEMVRTRQQRQKRQKRQKTRTTWLTFLLDFPGRLCITAFTILAMFGYCHCGSLFCKFSFLTTFLWVAFLDNIQNVVVGHCTANLLLWINFCKVASSIYCVQIIVPQFCKNIINKNKLQIIPLVNFWRHTDGQGQWTIDIYDFCQNKDVGWSWILWQCV